MYTQNLNFGNKSIEDVSKNKQENKCENTNQAKLDNETASHVKIKQQFIHIS